MDWRVLLHEDFAAEVEEFAGPVRRELLALIGLLERFGPHLGRPHCDTLNGSRHANMKELRFNAGDGAWRIAFAFDPERDAVLLVGGDKSGGSSAKFYKALIKIADRGFDDWLKE